MAKLRDEVITVATDDAYKTLTRASIDGTGNNRATLAIIHNHDLGDCAVGFRIGDTPDADTYAYVPIAAGGTVEISGYEALRDVRFLALGTVDAKLFVDYYA